MVVWVLSRVRLLWSHGLYVAHQNSAHGILQARLLEWFAVPSSRGFSLSGIDPRLLHCRWSPAPQADSLPTEPPGKSKCSRDYLFKKREDAGTSQVV